MKVWNKVIIIGMLAAAMAACSTAKKEEEPAVPTDQATTDSRQGAQDQGAISGSPFEDPSNPLSKRTVYFDFDSSEVKSADREVIMAHAQYLASHPQTKVVLEGHADERGSREYNIALGERRAKNVESWCRALMVGPTTTTGVERVARSALAVLRPKVVGVVGQWLGDYPVLRTAQKRYAAGR